MVDFVAYDAVKLHDEDYRRIAGGLGDVFRSCWSSQAMREMGLEPAVADIPRACLETDRPRQRRTFLALRYFIASTVCFPSSSARFWEGADVGRALTLPLLTCGSSERPLRGCAPDLEKWFSRRKRWRLRKSFSRGARFSGFGPFRPRGRATLRRRPRERCQMEALLLRQPQGQQAAPSKIPPGYGEARVGACLWRPWVRAGRVGDARAGEVVQAQAAGFTILGRDVPATIAFYCPI